MHFRYHIALGIDGIENQGLVLLIRVLSSHHKKHAATFGPTEVFVGAVFPFLFVRVNALELLDVNEAGLDVSSCCALKLMYQHPTRPVLLSGISRHPK